MSEPVRESLESSRFAPRCVSIDLEVGLRDARICRFAAVRGDTGHSYLFDKGDLAAALNKLDEFADGAAFLLGHNLIAFDAKHLAAAKPDLRLLKLPMVDTLRLNPLAFPRNPYHHLVKHYQDGQLKRGRLKIQNSMPGWPSMCFAISIRLYRRCRKRHRTCCSHGIG